MISSKNSKKKIPSNSINIDACKKKDINNNSKDHLELRVCQTTKTNTSGFQIHGIIFEHNTKSKKTKSTVNFIQNWTMCGCWILSSLVTTLSLRKMFFLHKKRSWCKCNTKNAMSTSCSVIFLLKFSNLNSNRWSRRQKKDSKCRRKSWNKS